MNNGKISNDTIFLSKYKTVTNKWGKISILKTTSRCGEKPEDPNKRRDAPCCGLDDIGVSFHQNQQNG